MNNVAMLADYQREIDEGELTAVANFEKLAFRVLALRHFRLDVSWARFRRRTSHKPYYI